MQPQGRIRWQKTRQRALRAAWLPLATPILSRIHDESVKLIVETRVAWKLALEEFPRALVVEFSRTIGVPVEDSVRVRIHDKHRMVSRVEKNGIGRLPPDAVNAQQLLAQIGTSACETSL